MRMVKKECEPTLTDQQIIQFCRDGYMEFPGAVSKDITDRALDYVAENPDYAMQPVPLLNESWFTDGLIFAPVVAGAVRSLLGAGFGLPWMLANHVGKCPDAKPLGWHVDGGNMHTWALNYLQVFCLMQDTTEEMGPTEVLPGSHFVLGQSALVTHYGAIRGTKKCVGPVGTVFLTCYPIWHRRSKATATGTTRHLFIIISFHRALKSNHDRLNPLKVFAKLACFFVRVDALEFFFDHLSEASPTLMPARSAFFVNAPLRLTAS